MYQTAIIIVLAIVCVAAGCGTERYQAMSAPTVFTERTVTEVEPVAAVLQTPVSRQMYQRIHFSSNPDTMQLPDVSELEMLEKKPSAVTEHVLSGSDFLPGLAGGNFELSGNSVAFSPAELDVSWAVYEFSGIGLYSTPQKLQVISSNAVFTGDQPGYWVGIADFDERSWQTLSQTTEEDYSRLLSTNSGYLHNGSVFIFVMLLGEQSLQVDQLVMEEYIPDWIECNVDSGANTGWSSAVAFGPTGNPIVVYSDYGSRKPKWAIGDASLDLRNPGNWLKGDIDPMIDSTALGATAKWLDLVVDPVSGNPRVSYIYDEIDTEYETLNSQVALATMINTLDGPFWWISLASQVDGAEYTTIDRHPDGRYGVVCSVENALRTELPSFDLHYRRFQINDPNDPMDDGSIILTRNFGEGYRYPHIRYKPLDGNPAVSYDGGHMIYESAADDWSLLYEATNSTMANSIAWSPVTGLLSQVFTRTELDSEILQVVNYSSDLLGLAEPLESINTLGGQSIGECSQIAFQPDGTPAVAYTLRDSATMQIKYAEFDGANWNVKVVSEFAYTSFAFNSMTVDLAFGETGEAAISYNRIDGANSTLHLLFRGLQ